MDHMANPYYALAGLIYGGLNGIKNKTDMPPIIGDPASFEKSVLEKNFIFTIPKTVEEAQSFLFSQDEGKPILNGLGERFLQAVLAPATKDNEVLGEDEGKMINHFMNIY
jgi:glutamine synthetase